ncbi:PBP1A family penicillin-binding protein [Paenibacillus sp. BC26]|uniref:PBP1A family penicillin-binding protein n=1 Tax=Paenibacillus sp. BC26 TaxID=1881032 RepID=UPI0008E590E6|nr:PBP1A family penicillin-binding protein [Paenibacillus sp. BC26]SFS61965.1 penicillin-binding protein 2A [Paenibacillus sp. BC26]
MADGPRSTRNKKVEKKGKKTNKKRKWAVWLFFTGAVAIVCGIIGYLLIILNGERILAENQDKFILPESSTIYDSKGKEVTKLSSAGGNRETVEFDDIPLLMREAVIATEDRRFEEHSGIDLYSIGRAVVKDIVARSAVEGGSTITQQLAKNLFLTQDKTFFRKATEASIAIALEHKKTKDEIITMYLNRIYFGKGAYGIKEAASFYFDTELKDLKLWQMATLAAIPKAPGNYNPINNPINSQERRAVVLQLMFDQGYITQAEMDEAKAVEYKRPENQTKSADDSNLTFIDYVVDEAVEKSGLTEEELRVGGYKIYTTLNTQAQSVMAREFEDDDNFEKSVDDKQVQGAMIIVDHRNGEIQGMVGGRDYVNKGTNRVVERRQPGSAFKPITVYGPAVESGDWYPWSILQDVKTCYGSYCPTDSNKVKYIGPVPMRQSLKESRNASAVWLLNEIGVKTGLKFADKMGFELDSSRDRNLAIGLGGLTNGVTPFEMARAYSAFANEGKSVDPHALIKITDKNEEVLYQYDAPQPEQLMSPETAYYMTDMMQAVTEKGGTGTAARIDRPVAGKTGTTQHGIPGLKTGYNRDAWFAGYTAEWTAVVWMGYDITDKNHMIKKSSAQSAAMFGKVMKDAIKGVKKGSFAKPSDVQEEKPPVGITNFNAIYDEAAAFVKLSWSPIEGEGVQYHVYRKEASEKAFTKLLDSLEPVVDDMTVAPGMSYTYYVTAYDANKDMEGTPSDQLTVEIPEAEITPPPTEEPGGEVPPGDGNETPPGDEEPGDGTTPPGDGNNGGETPGNGGETPGNGGETPGNGGQPTDPGNGNGNNPGNGTGDSGNTPGGDGSVPADGQPDPGAGNSNGNGATNSPPPTTP